MKKVVSWLNLHLYIPQRDVRKIIYSMLNKGDRIAVQFAHTNTMTSPQSYDFANHCAKYGYIELFEWARENGCGPIYGMTGIIAARHGRLEVLQWLTSIGKPYSDIPVTANAAENGHLHVLKWLHTQISGPYLRHICYYAAKGGHLNVIEWAVDNCLRKGGASDDETQLSAARYGHLHILKWLVQHNTVLDTHWCLYKAVRRGHYNVFMWLITSYDIVLTNYIYTAAAKGGNVDIIRTLRNHGITIKRIN
jgi:hypothetical protein